MADPLAPSGNSAYDAMLTAAGALREHRDNPQKPLIRVDLTTSSVAAGADALLGELRREADSRGIDCEIITVGTLGFSFAQPTVEVQLPGKQPVVYGPVRPGTAGAFLAQAVLGEEAEADSAPALGVRPSGSTLRARVSAQDGVPSLHDHPFWGPQERRLMEWMGVIDPDDIEEAISVGRYAGLARAMALEPMAICDMVESSGVGGRGGAGFPAGRKWKFLLGSPGPTKYIILNADEGDPGAYVNRVLMESDPHLVLEGMAIAGRAAEASHGFIYIRDEYPLAVERMVRAIAQAEAKGLLGDGSGGDGALGSGNIQIRVVQGAGAYVCGEETGLIASVEGLRGMPKIRPPFPAERGVFGKPSNVNNTETYANAPLALVHGADWYREAGTESDPGSKMFSISGSLQRSGIVELPFGFPMDRLMMTMGGGPHEGHTPKGIQPGGPLGGILNADDLGLDLERPPFGERGVLLGSGGLILFDERACPVDLAYYFAQFCESESCGRCTTCHGGSQRMVEILHRVIQGGGREGDLEQLGVLDDTMQNANCIHGQFTPYAIRGISRHFGEELREHIVGKRCRARSCAGLIEYTITDPADPDLEAAAELDTSGTLRRGDDGLWSLSGRGAEEFGVLPELAPEGISVGDRFASPDQGIEQAVAADLAADPAADLAVAGGG